MWGDKKQGAPVRMPLQQQPREVATPVKEIAAPVQTFSKEAVKMAPIESTYPTTVSERASGSTARLGAGLHLKGEISGNEDLAIDGSVEGLIQLEDRKLTIGASARVTADVVAREVVVYGNVKGNLRARDRIEIKKDGSVVGDLTTARIMIEDGAYFKGSIEIDKTSDAGESERKSLARTAASTTASAV